MGKETLKAFGREALRTGGMILTDIAENPKAETQDIISKHVSDSTQKIINALGGGGTPKREHCPPHEMKNERENKIGLT